MSTRQPFHADYADILLEALWNHFAQETAILRVHHVDGHLRGIPGVRLCQHLQVNARLFVTCEADESDFSGLARFERSLDSAFFEPPVRIVVVNQLVELPEV